MAGHVDSTEQIDDETTQNAETPQRRLFSGKRSAIIAVAVIVGALAGLTGWLSYRDYQTREAQAQQNLYVQVARQAAVNLTTISYTEADADVQRILDSATGTFRDDFQQRSRPFVDVVKQAQSKSEGMVGEAGLESISGDQARVLVAVSVKTSIATAPEQEPRRWRLRITVADTSDGAKVSNVEFVP